MKRQGGSPTLRVVRTAIPPKQINCPVTRRRTAALARFVLGERVARMAKKAVKYDEKAIQTLDALEHIRLRTGMYIGRLGDGNHPLDGIYVMLKEVVDNSVDEFIMGEGKKIEISRAGSQITVRDYGRGIPLGKLVECVSQINTGGKYND
ncbi:MAG: hypothetical protein ACI9QQ_002660, partial [Myxococcota bacterium]